MAYLKQVPAGLHFVGDQKITLAATTPQSLNSTIRAASRKLIITVETANVRYRWGGGNPNLSTGNIIFANSTVEFDGYNGTSLLKFCRATGAPIMYVTGLKYKGDV